jgi:uncharacterized protein YuzB (UPF0349 family)
MSIQDLEPYLDRVDLFLKGNGVPNQTILKEIRDIYDVTIKDKRLAKTSLGCGNCITRMFNQIQGAANRGEIVKQGKHMKFPKVEQIDLEDQIADEESWFDGVKTANQETFDKIKHQGLVFESHSDLEEHTAEETGSYFNVDTKVIRDYIKERNAEVDKQTKAPIETLEIKTDLDIINYNRMAWGAFKKHCTSKGIKVKGKTKEQLLKELES